MSDEMKTPQTTEAAKKDRLKTFSRRALVQAGWAVPVVMAIAMPRVAGAASSHGDIGGGPGGNPIHTDGFVLHADNGGVGPQHADLQNAPHNDFAPHFDVPPGGAHIDQLGGNPGQHLDSPVGSPHNDFPSPLHNDLLGGPGAHGDIP